MNEALSEMEGSTVADMFDFLSKQLIRLQVQYVFWDIFCKLLQGMHSPLYVVLIKYREKFGLNPLYLSTSHFKRN